MSKTTTKNYIKGSAKEVKFDNGGTVINLSLNIDELNNLPATKGYIKLVIAERRETDEYGNTHSVFENPFVPDSSAKAPAAKSTSKEDDLPF